MNVIERAKELRKIIESVMEAQDDKTASKAAEFYPKMALDGKLIKAGTRINWNGKVMKAAADLWDREENSPENVPALWAELGFVFGVRIIPEIITAAEAFALGECGFWKQDGKIYKSIIDSNVFTPIDYPDGWEEQK